MNNAGVSLLAQSFLVAEKGCMSKSKNHPRLVMRGLRMALEKAWLGPSPTDDAYTQNFCHKTKGRFYAPTKSTKELRMRGCCKEEQTLAGRVPLALLCPIYTCGHCSNKLGSKMTIGREPANVGVLVLKVSCSDAFFWTQEIGVLSQERQDIKFYSMCQSKLLILLQKILRAGTARWLSRQRCLPPRLTDLSSIPRPPIIKGEKQLQAVLRVPQVCHGTPAE